MKFKKIKPIEKQAKFSDRFIPKRNYEDDIQSKYDIIQELGISPKDQLNNNSEQPQQEESDSTLSYKTLLHSQVLGIKDQFTIHQLNGTNYIYEGYPYTQKLNLFNSYKNSIENQENLKYSLPSLCGLIADEQNTLCPPKIDRKIPKIPFKVLDAPALQDDFYLNVVDWSSQGQLAVGLGSNVYLWSAGNGKVTKLNDVGPEDSITSVGWAQKGNILAVGTLAGFLQLWDVKKCKQLRTFKDHDGRIGSVAWTSQILSTGSRDKAILHRDIRSKNANISKSLGHKQEVCGLKWSNDEQQLSSGGNDNKLFIWSIQNLEQASNRFTSHTAAVKALAWSPHQHGLLASGGGTADRCIRFWNTLTGTSLDCIDTGSQVCSMLFGKNVNELVTAHGYSQNQIIVWKYPSLRKLATLTGHTYRVLYMSMSNDGETVVTGAGDETLRFWKIFPASTQVQTFSSLLIPSNKDLR